MIKVSSLNAPVSENKVSMFKLTIEEYRNSLKIISD